MDHLLLLGVSEGSGNVWFTGGMLAAGAMIVACWRVLQGLWAQAANRVIANVTVTDEQAEAVMAYLRDNFKTTTYGPREFFARRLFVATLSRTQLVSLETVPSGGKFYWQGWRKVLWASRPRENKEDSGYASSSANSLVLRFAHGTFNVEKLILDSTEAFNQHIRLSSKTRRRHYVRHVSGTAGQHMGQSGPRRSQSGSDGNSPRDLRVCLSNRLVGYALEDLVPATEGDKSPLDFLALPDEAYEMIREARHWLTEEDWYRSKGAPWSQGWLLHGEAGSGKSAFASAIALELDLPVFVFHLATLSDEELRSEWISMRSQGPCIALIEDIDTVFNLRTNVTAGMHLKLTFGALLNCLSGIDGNDGIFTIVTTNDLDAIDPALGKPGVNGESTRAFRLGRTLKMNGLNSEGRRKIVEFILDDFPERWDEVIQAGVAANDNGSSFVSRCIHTGVELRHGRSLAENTQSLQCNCSATCACSNC